MTKEQIQKLSEKLVEVFQKQTPPPKELPQSDLNKSELIDRILIQLKNLKSKVK